MAIDTSLYDEIQGTSHEKIWSRFAGDHEVARMRYSGIDINGKEYTGEALYCECDFVFETEYYERPDGTEGTRIVMTRDSHQCEAKGEVRRLIKKEAREKHGELWKEIGTKEAILDIYGRVKQKEYMGQTYDDIIYVQEVAELLDLPVRDVWSTCDELFAEERLNLNGAILCDYTARFRFPKEIQALFAYIIEEPLGWPNGDAGDGFLYALENAIHENTNYKHGKDAFYEHNYPNLAPEYLIMFGLMWLRSGIARTMGGDKKHPYSQTNIDGVIAELEKLIADIKRNRASE